MKRFLFAPLLILVAIAAQLSCTRRTSTESRSAAPSPTEQAAIDEILQRYEQATGGQEAIAAIKSYRLKGTFQLARITGNLEAWRKEPLKSLVVLTFPGGVLKKGFDGETHWVQTPAGTFTDSSPQEEIAKFERDADAYTAGKIRSMFETMKLEHKARLSGRDMHVIEGKPARGPAEKLFFDVESGLLARWDMARREPNRGTVFVKVHFDDYRDVGGVKTPFKVRFAFESFNLIVQVHEQEHNISVDDAMFRKP